MGGEAKLSNGLNKLAVALAAVIVYNLLLTAVLGYAGYYAMTRFDSLSKDKNVLQDRVDVLQERVASLEQSMKEMNSTTGGVRNKREVISSNSQTFTFSVFPALQRIFASPPDSTEGGPEVAQLQKIINTRIETVGLKQWSKLSAALPPHGGATYIRWGRTVCPATSELIYSGSMAGPNRASVGGGVNLQCLPSQPEYEKEATLTATSSDIHLTFYSYIKGALKQRLIPCALCQTKKERLTKLMIPAKTRCPGKDWVLEYKGYIYSAATQYANDDLVSHQHSTTYECLDSQEETRMSEKTTGMPLSVLSRVRVRCAPGAPNGCLPYLEDKPLSCVVCSK